MNWASEKKRAEKAVLRMVYDLDAFESVEESERPDFVLRRSATAGPFGIEITRLYDSEPSARIDNIEGYAGDLLKGGRYRHKDDTEALPVKEVKLIDPDGKVKAVTMGIMQSLSPVADHIRMIAERIEAKDAALSESRAGLTHVNLVVLDKATRLIGCSPEYFCKLLFTDDLKRVLATTRFREVFFVTKVREARKVFFPLRMLLLVSELYTFNGARIGSSSDEAAVHSSNEELALFASFMRLRGIPVELAEGTTAGSVQVILGNSGVLVTDDKVSIRDYMDWPLPQSRTPPVRAFSESFLAFYDEYLSEHVFTSGIVFDVRT
jgi:hypothetical protein